MARVARVVKDKRVLKLIRAYLESGVMAPVTAGGGEWGSDGHRGRYAAGWAADTFNNVAKTVIEFLITISRDRLRPQYGDGFRGAPLATSVLVQGTTRRDRGAIQDESGAKKETDTSGGTDV